MKTIILSIIVLLASISKADTIKCTFTEPFINSTYSMTDSTLTYVDIENKITVMKNVSFEIKDSGVFELVKDGQVLQMLALSFKGSDGMSDLIYPYEVKDSTMDGMANNGFGGCSSNHLKVRKVKTN